MPYPSVFSDDPKIGCLIPQLLQRILHHSHYFFKIFRMDDTAPVLKGVLRLVDSNSKNPASFHRAKKCFSSQIKLPAPDMGNGLCLSVSGIFMKKLLLHREPLFIFFNDIQSKAYILCSFF